MATLVAKVKLYRVIDACEHVLTTTDPVKALRKLQDLLDKHNITWAWYEEEELE